MPTIIKGFSKQKIITVDWLLTTIKSIPDMHLRGITTIAYDPDRYFQRSYVMPKAINYSVKGQYSNAPIDHILLYDFNSAEECRHILFHEIGHHVYNRVIGSTLKKEWVTKIYPNSLFVSEYARTNASEDFAESYAFYLTSKVTLQKIPGKYHFIKSLFENGH